MRKNKKNLTEITGQDFKKDIWINLSPSERLARSWAMRKLLKNPKDVHDKKIFPQP